MALVNTPIIAIPGVDYSAISAKTFTIDASGEKVSFVFSVPATGTITTVDIRTDTVAQDTNGLTVGIQTVDASGDPTGSAYGSMVAGTTAATSSDTWYTVTLGTGATAVKGDVVAVVIEFTNFQAGDDVDIAAVDAIHAKPGRGYVNAFTGSWSKSTLRTPVVSAGYGGTYYPLAGCQPGARESVNVNTGTTPDEIALRFQLTFGARAWGAWVVADVDAIDDFSIVLYEDDDSVVETLAVDAAQLGSAAVALHQFAFAGSDTLSAGTWYKLAIKPTTGNSLALQRGLVASAAAMGGYPLGIVGYQSSRSDAGGWTSDTVRRPFIGLIIDQIETGAGGGRARFRENNL